MCTDVWVWVWVWVDVRVAVGVGVGVSVGVGVGWGSRGVACLSARPARRSVIYEACSRWELTKVVVWPCCTGKLPVHTAARGTPSGTCLM